MSDDTISRTGMKRFLPSLEESYELVREVTLVIFVVFTLMSLAVFWAELGAAHDAPRESIVLILRVIDGIAGLVVLWAALRVAILVRQSRRGDSMSVSANPFVPCHECGTEERFMTMKRSDDWTLEYLDDGSGEWVAYCKECGSA